MPDDAEPSADASTPPAAEPVDPWVAPGEAPLDPPLVARGGRPLLVAWRDTWVLAALKPGRFFLHVRTDRSGTAVLFGLVSASLGLFVSSFYSALNRLHWWDASRDVALELGPGGQSVVDRYLPYLATGFSLAEALTAPLKALVGIYVGAGAIHLLLALLRARTRPFEATLTTVGYAFGVALLLALPVCGFPIVAAWLALVLVLGVAAAHRASLVRSAVAVFTPGALVLAFGFRPWLAGMFALVRTVRAGLGVP